MKIDDWDEILKHALKCGHIGFDGIVQSAYSVGRDIGLQIGVGHALNQKGNTKGESGEPDDDND